MDKSIIDNRNFDNVLIRKVLVGVVTFLHKKITFEQVVDGETEIIQVPFYPSHTGSQQFISDAYLDVVKYYRDTCKIVTEGNTVPVPNGIVKLKSIGINKSHFTSQNVRTNTTTVKDSDFGKVNNTESVRTTFIPMSMVFDIEMTMASTVDQFKVAESAIAELVGVRKFFIGNYKGYKMLPVLIGFPEEYQLQTLFQFPPGEDSQRRKLEFSVEILTWLPRPLAGTNMKKNERITLYQVTGHEKLV